MFLKAPRSLSKPYLSKCWLRFDWHSGQFRWEYSQSWKTVKWKEEIESIWNPCLEGKSRRHYRGWVRLVCRVPNEHIHEEDNIIFFHNEDFERSDGFVGKIRKSLKTRRFGCSNNWNWHWNSEWRNVHLLRRWTVYFPWSWRAWYGKT